MAVRRQMVKLDKLMKIFQFSFRIQKYLKGKEHVFHRQTGFSYKSQCIHLGMYVCVCVCVCARARVIARKCTCAT